MKEIIKNLKRFFTKGFNFQGRATRAEYWYPLFVFLFIYLFILLVMMLFLLFFRSQLLSVLLIGLMVLLSLIIFIPSLAVSIRRLHDTNKAWSYILLGLLPGIGAIILIVFFIQPGDTKRNHFGINHQMARKRSRKRRRRKTSKK